MAQGELIPGRVEWRGQCPPAIEVSAPPTLVKGDMVRLAERRYESPTRLCWCHVVTARILDVRPIKGGLRLELRYLDGPGKDLVASIDYRSGGMWIWKALRR